MRAFNFFKIDCIRCRAQILFGILIMFIFTVLFGFSETMLGFSTSYIFFMAVMFAGQPFNVESQCDSGFIDMIPGTRRERVAGRFLYAFACLCLASVMRLGVLLMYKMRVGEVSSYAFNVAFGMVGAGFFMIGIQYISLYVAGKGRSQQFIVLIQMVPPMALFFIAYTLGKQLRKNHMLDLEWILAHKDAISYTILGVGILVLGIAFFVCDRITEKRDYA